MDSAGTDADNPRMAAPLTASDRPRLFLLDGMALAYRAHFAIQCGAGRAGPVGPATSKGAPTGAVFGFLLALDRILEQEKPEELVVVVRRAGAHVPPPARTRTTRRRARRCRTRCVPQLDVDPPRGRRGRASRSSSVAGLRGRRRHRHAGAARGRARARTCGSSRATRTCCSSSATRVRLYNVLKPRRGRGRPRRRGEAIREGSASRPSSIIDVLGLMGDASDNVPGRARASARRPPHG